MLALDSPRWQELAQAYGSARDIPRLLDHLERVTDEQRAELWFGLWSTLCREGRVYTAAYAAVPQLVAFAERRPIADRVQALHLVGGIEAGRHGGHAPPVPGDLAAAYHDAVARVPAIIARSVGEPWGADTTQVLAGVLAIAKGHRWFGMAALNLEPVIVCPVCGAAHAAPGWEPPDAGEA